MPGVLFDPRCHPSSFRLSHGSTAGRNARAGQIRESTLTKYSGVDLIQRINAAKTLQLFYHHVTHLFVSSREGGFIQTWSARLPALANRQG
jgi:hypothetical protein